MTSSTQRVTDYFDGVRDGISVEEVRMSGAWSEKTHRHDAVETVDWRWDGAFDSSSPLVGIALLVVDSGFYWVKSQPPVLRPAVSFSTHGWAARPCYVSVTGTFHGAFLPSAPADASDEPPASCVIGDPMASTGTPHVIGRLKEVAFAVLLLPASAVKVGRNRLWHLRESIAERLPRALRDLTTRRRSGEVSW
jgi:hypothetical protein